MIAVDSSALIAILCGEAMAAPCARALVDDSRLLISAVTLAESLMVSRTRKVESELVDLVAELPFEIIAADEEAPWRINEIHRRWGKGNHRAQLNICDCFAYDVARQFGCPLLYIGNDFAQTDIPGALA